MKNPHVVKNFLLRFRSCLKWWLVMFYIMLWLEERGRGKGIVGTYFPFTLLSLDMIALYPKQHHVE